MTPEMAIGEIVGTQYGFSESGWTNSILFDSWFKKQFMRYACTSRQAYHTIFGWTLLTLFSRYDCLGGIIIFTLPPNTTHLTQPLDKGVFGPFKQHWRGECVMTLK